jgi:hypothetical protein
VRRYGQRILFFKVAHDGRQSVVMRLVFGSAITPLFYERFLSFKMCMISSSLFVSFA